MWPRAPRKAGFGAGSGSGRTESGASSWASSARQSSCQPTKPLTVAPTGMSSRRDSMTSPIPSPRITLPSGTAGM